MPGSVRQRQPGVVARGETRPGSDIDLLVVVDDETGWTSAAKVALLAVARLEPEIDVIVTTRARVDANREQPGTIIRSALSEGRVVRERAARPPGGGISQVDGRSG